jgi:hypothetical protein
MRFLHWDIEDLRQKLESGETTRELRFVDGATPVAWFEPGRPDSWLLKGRLEYVSTRQGR